MRKQAQKNLSCSSKSWLLNIVLCWGNSWVFFPYLSLHFFLSVIANSFTPIQSLNQEFILDSLLFFFEFFFLGDLFHSQSFKYSL